MNNPASQAPVGLPVVPQTQPAVPVLPAENFADDMDIDLSIPFPEVFDE